MENLLKWYKEYPIRKAVNACADNPEMAKIGLLEGRKALKEKRSQKAVMIMATQKATSDPKKVKQGEKAFVDAVKSRRVGVSSISGLAAVLVVFMVARSFFPIAAQTVSISEEITETTIISAAIEIMKAEGWIQGEDYEFVNDGQSDGAAKGLQYDYAPKGTYNPHEVINHLTSTVNGKAEHAAMVDYLKEPNSDGELNPESYHFVKATHDFEYRYNSGIKDGVISHNDTTRISRGYKGQIFILYISPSTGGYLTLRALCANLQFLFPSPDVPETTTIMSTTVPETDTTVPETATTQPGTTKPATTKPATTKLEKTTKALGHGAFIDDNTVNYEQGTDKTETDEEIGVTVNWWSAIKDAFTNDPGTVVGPPAADDVTVLTTRYIPPPTEKEIETIVHSETNEDF